MSKSTIIFVVILLFIFGVAFAENSETTKTEIYSALRCCACKEPFNQCVCPEAREMKAYINALLEIGVAKDDIFYKLAKKYSLNVIVDNQVKLKLEKRLADEIGLKRPQIKLISNSYNFGELHKSQGLVKKIFPIYNKGKAELVINNIKTSCGCVSVSLTVGKQTSPFFGTAGAVIGWQAIIKADRKAELEVVIDLKHSSVRAGKLIRNVSISSNDPFYPELTLELEAIVEE
jgi:hypothetical protein